MRITHSLGYSWVDVQGLQLLALLQDGDKDLFVQHFNLPLTGSYNELRQQLKPSTSPGLAASLQLQVQEREMLLKVRGSQLTLAGICTVSAPPADS